MLVILISLVTLVSTALGGLFALRFQDKLHLVLGFSAGALLGVAFFDLLPETLRLSADRPVETVMLTVVAGFILYMILDRFSMIHAHDELRGPNLRGTFGATGLCVHSVLDGVAIGLAFQVSTAVGAIIATAVLVHDFSDGINTVSLILKNKGESRAAYRWLAADAIAPMIGATSTLFFRLPESAIGMVLALFTGFFLYLGACDLLPESYHDHPHTLTTAMTILGMATLFLAVHFAS